LHAAVVAGCSVMALPPGSYVRQCHSISFHSIM
jgi:hypothetical protein